MNLISRSLENITYTIPREVLELVFNKNRNGISNNVLNEIEFLVIRPRVLIDANIVGGTQMRIRLEDTRYQMTNDGGILVNIPKALTNNRSVVSVENIISTGYGWGDEQRTNQANGVGGAVGQAYKMVTNTESPAVDVSSKITIVGENTLYIEDFPHTIGGAVISVLVSNMDNLENLGMRNSLSFNKLVQYAVEAYIYNELAVRINKGVIYQGHSLEALDSIVSEYKDSNNLYLEELTTNWSVVSFLADTPRKANYIKTLFGNA